MKAIFTLLFVLFIGVAAQAQDKTTNVKVETIEMSVVTLTNLEKTIKENKVEVARLYKFKNSRIKKALSFTGKKKKAKMA